MRRSWETKREVKKERGRETLHEKRKTIRTRRNHRHTNEGGREGGKEGGRGATYLIIDKNCNGRNHALMLFISSNRPENKAMGMITTEPAAIAAVVFLNIALKAYPMLTAAFAHKIRIAQNVIYAPPVGRKPTIPYTMEPNTKGNMT